MRPDKKSSLPMILVCVSVVVIVAAGAVAALQTDWWLGGEKAYSEQEFDKLLRGKTEAEVTQLLGLPDATDYEPAASPQANKKWYVYTLPKSSWSVRGQSGAVGLFFSRDKGRVDHIQFIDRPQQANGVLIVRF